MSGGYAQLIKRVPIEEAIDRATQELSGAQATLDDGELKPPEPIFRDAGKLPAFNVVKRA